MRVDFLPEALASYGTLPTCAIMAATASPSAPIPIRRCETVNGLRGILCRIGVRQGGKEFVAVKTCGTGDVTQRDLGAHSARRAARFAALARRGHGGAGAGKAGHGSFESTRRSCVAMPSLSASRRVPAKRRYAARRLPRPSGRAHVFAPCPPGTRAPCARAARSSPRPPLSSQVRD